MEITKGNAFDVQTTIADIQITLQKIKTIANVYEDKFVAALDVNERIMAIKTEAETQQLLFSVLNDEIETAIQKASVLET